MQQRFLFEEVESVLFLSLDILICGNNDSLTKTFLIIRNLISNLYYLLDGTSRKNCDVNSIEKNEINQDANQEINQEINHEKMKTNKNENLAIFHQLREIFEEYFECMISFVMILIHPSNVPNEYSSGYSRSDPRSKCKNDSERKGISFSEKIYIITLLFSQRIYIDSKDIKKNMYQHLSVRYYYQHVRA